MRIALRHSLIEANRSNSILLCSINFRNTVLSRVSEVDSSQYMNQHDAIVVVVIFQSLVLI
jgi:hypothetical protein